VPERERDDALFRMRPDLVGHPWPAPLADAQRLQTPPVDLGLPAVIRRSVDAHRPACRRDVAQLVGEREQAQAQSDEHVMLCHRLLLL
jgi:hypothetical protein